MDLGSTCIEMFAISKPEGSRKAGPCMPCPGANTGHHRPDGEWFAILHVVTNCGSIIQKQFQYLFVCKAQGTLYSARVLVT